MTFARASLLLAAVSGAVVLGTATAAAAHVEVSANKQQAGAIDVTVTFSAEAEQDNAGISAVEIILPTGIVAADVTMVSAPSGWALSASALGVRLSGAPLPAGKDADYSIKVAQFPIDQSTLAFKTLVSYTNGDIDRWIEIPVAGQPEPPHPAPVLELTGIVSPAPSTSNETSSSGGPTTTGPAATAQSGKNDGGSNAIWWVVGALVLVGAIGVGVAATRRGRHAG